MNTKIKLFSVAIVALASLFLDANFASAQTATATTCSSATLNGTITDTSGVQTSAWFEWGTNYGDVGNGAGTRTVSQVFSYPQSFNQTIYSLNQSTTYYYRAVVSNMYGSAQGGIFSFTTPSCSSTNYNYSQPYVSTNSATYVYQNSATLNGYMTSNGVSNVNAWFEWGTSYSLGNSTSYNNYGSGSTGFNSSLFNLNQNTTYYYRAVAQSAYGTVYGSTLSFTTTGQSYNYNYSYNQPYVTTNSVSSITQNSAMLNGYVMGNGTNTSAWFEWGRTASFGNTTTYTNYGTGAASYNATLLGLAPNTTYYYRAVANNSQGTIYGSTLSFATTNGAYNNAYGVSPTVTTLLATELTGTTARLNGLVFETGSQSSNAWFEWGATASLGNNTQTTNVGALPTVKHSDYITGLALGQTYYFRLVAQNSYGTSYGSVNTFVSTASTYAVTPTVTPTKPAVLKPVTIVVTNGSSEQSLVALSIEGGAEMIGSGEKRTYHVTWKNDSAQSLNDVVLRVTFPKTINIDSATNGTFSSTDNSVIVDLKTLASKESGDTFIFATTGRGFKSGEVLVVTANMVYTSTNGIQGDAVAYVMHRTEMTQNAVGANIFGAGEFVPTTLFEWVLLMILTLILVLLGNHLYGRFADQK